MPLISLGKNGMTSSQSASRREKSVTVRDIMTRPVITISPDSAIGPAIRLMRDGNFRRLPVVEAGKLVGIVTDRDLRQATNSPQVLRERWYSDFLLDAIKVRACMTSDPVTVDIDASVLDAVVQLRRYKIGGLPVLENGLVAGIVSTTDVLDYLITLLSQEQGEDFAGK